MIDSKLNFIFDHCETVYRGVESLFREIAMVSACMADLIAPNSIKFE